MIWAPREHIDLKTIFTEVNLNPFVRAMAFSKSSSGKKKKACDFEAS